MVSGQGNLSVVVDVERKRLVGRPRAEVTKLILLTGGMEPSVKLAGTILVRNLLVEVTQPHGLSALHVLDLMAKLMRRRLAHLLDVGLGLLLGLDVDIAGNRNDDPLGLARHLVVVGRPA